MNARIVPAVNFIHGSIGATRVQMITLRFIGGSEMKLCIWFVCVSPALCISPRRELSLNSHRSSTFFFSPSVTSHPPLWEPLLYRIKYKSVQWWVVFFMHFKHSFLCRSRYFIFAVFICRSVKIMPTLNRSVVQKRLGTPDLADAFVQSDVKGREQLSYEQ